MRKWGAALEDQACLLLLPAFSPHLKREQPRARKERL